MPRESIQPCGCVILTDDAKTFINGVDMSAHVANICGVRRCAQHDAEWKAGIKAFSDRMDAQIAARVYREMFP